jgi:hypothetical protein
MDWLIAIDTACLVLAVPLLRLYLRERVTNLARQETEMALATYRHEYDRALTDVNARNQRLVQDYGVFAQKQHDIYARLFKRVRVACDSFSLLMDFHEGPSFRKFDSADIEAFRTQHGLRTRDLAAASAAVAGGNQSAVESAMNDLYYKVRRRDADRAFKKTKNIEALYELYLSDPVRAAMSAVRHTMAPVSVSLMRESGDHDVKLVEKKEAMEDAVSRLYHVMRGELQRGVVEK